MSFCDLDEKSDEIFSATRMIRSACQTAGFQLAGKLLEVMRGKELVLLYSEGSQEFRGVEGMSNSKVAYYVTSILREDIEASVNHLQRPFPVDSSTWL